MHLFNPRQTSAPGPVVVWEGHAVSNRGRRRRYRVVALADPTNPLFTHRHIVVEVASTDSLGERSWTDCGHSLPKGFIAALVRSLAEASAEKGGAA